MRRGCTAGYTPRSCPSYCPISSSCYAKQACSRHNTPVQSPQDRREDGLDPACLRPLGGLDQPCRKEVTTVDVLLIIIVALVAIAVGVGLGYILKQRTADTQRLQAETSAGELRASADAEKKVILLEAKEEAIRTRASAEDEA